MSIRDIGKLFLDYSLLVIPIVIYPYYLVFKRQNNTTSRSFYISVFYLSVALFLMLVQRRFHTLFLGIYIILASELIVKLLKIVQRKAVTKSWKIGIVLLLIMGFIPFSIFKKEQRANSKLGQVFSPLKNACSFLKHRASLSDEAKSGILSNWDLGHWIVYYCDMPVVLSPLAGHIENQSRFAQAADIFYSEDMRKVKRELERFNVKYIISLLPTESFQRLGEKLKHDKSYLIHEGKYWYYGEHVLPTFNARLSFLQKDKIPPWLKIIYVSPETAKVGKKKLPIIVIAEFEDSKL